MTEFSMPWPDTSVPGPQVGDGRKITAEEMRHFWEALFGLGVVRGALGWNDLAVTSPTANQVQVASGVAIVKGTAYLNSTPVTLAVANAPAGSVRKDSVILACIWTASGQYTVRAGVKQGDAVNPPAMTTIDDTIWQLRLYDYTVDSVGAISGLGDKRPYTRFNTEVAEAMLADAAVTAAKLADGAITTAKLAAKAVATAKLGDKAVGAGQLADGAVADAQIAANAAIAQSKISNASPTIDADKVDGLHASDLARADLRMYSLTGDETSWAIPGPSANYSDIKFKTWGDVERDTISFSTMGACDVVIQFSGVIQGPMGAGTFDVMPVMDGTSRPPASNSASFTGALHFCAAWPASVTAGNHTVKLRFRHDQGSTPSSIGDRYLAVMVFPRP